MAEAVARCEFDILTFLSVFLPSETVTSLPTAPATPTLKELSNELATVEKWHKLGVNLGLQGHQLRKLQEDYPRDSDRRKCEMLDIWLRNVQNPTWKVIVEALNLMQENVVADVIWRKYCCQSSTVPGQYPSRKAGAQSENKASS